MRWFLRLVRLIRPKCPECEEGRLRHAGDDLVSGGVWLSVAECDRCGKEFV